MFRMGIALLLASAVLLAACTNGNETNNVGGKAAVLAADDKTGAGETGTAGNTQTTIAGDASKAAGITKGLAETTVEKLVECRGGRIAALGTIADANGEEWVVPAAIDDTIAAAGDMANECTGVEFANVAAIDLDSLPVVEVDPDGVLITGYIFADNYFELYVNGKPVARDTVPFTPFNASFVRFKAKYPITYAIKAVDWEENLGVGTEDNRGNAFHYGDGGIVAVFSDGTSTDGDWKAQNFYVAPLADPADLVVTSQNGITLRSAPDYQEPPSCGEACYGAHFAEPDDWQAAAFDDSDWPAAVVYAEDDVGVDNKRSYTNFASTFRQGEFVWTGSLTLDNVVLLRHTVEAAAK